MLAGALFRAPLQLPARCSLTDNEAATLVDTLCRGPRLSGQCLLLRPAFCQGLWLNEGRTIAAERNVNIFRNGRNQAVRIPREFELPGDKAPIRKQEGCLVMEPAPPQSLVALLKQLQPIEDDFGPIPDPAPDPVKL